jgi:hypothetical protein
VGGLKGSGLKEVVRRLEDAGHQLGSEWVEAVWISVFFFSPFFFLNELRPVIWIIMPFLSYFLLQLSTLFGCQRREYTGKCHHVLDFFFWNLDFTGHAMSLCMIMNGYDYYVYFS